MLFDVQLSLVPNPIHFRRSRTSAYSFLFGLLVFVTAGGVSSNAQPVPTTGPAEPPLAWHDITEWGVEGRAFADEPRDRWFDRLPAAAQSTVTEKVWELSRYTAGMMVRFKTDAAEIWVDYALSNANLAGSNMTRIGASGLDLYARNNEGEWRWVGVAQPNTQTVRQRIVATLAPAFREFSLYLPLYNGVDRLSIGVPANARFERLGPRAQKPMVFYGTSITNGASASRPGMVHTAILGRRLDVPVVNLGFSGNGKMDEAVGELLTRIDAAVYVIDCLPNMNASLVSERCIPLVKQLRAVRPGVPIVLVEDRRNANSWIRPERNQHHTDNHRALQKCFEALQKEGVQNLHYLQGDDLLGHDGEGTTDGSHPNDLGFFRHAALFEPLLRQVVKQSVQ